jgi:hypothetical protein
MVEKLVEQLQSRLQIPSPLILKKLSSVILVARLAGKGI